MDTGDRENSLADWRVGMTWRPQGPEQINSMPPDVRIAFERAQAIAVFGSDVRFSEDGFTPLKDAEGRVIESGIGAPGRETFQSRAALQKAEGTQRDLRTKAGLAAGAPAPADVSALEDEIATLKARLAAVETPKKSKRRGNAAGLAKARAANLAAKQAAALRDEEAAAQGVEA